jgi:hypothetical protein
MKFATASPKIFSLLRRGFQREKARKEREKARNFTFVIFRVLFFAEVVLSEKLGTL